MKAIHNSFLQMQRLNFNVVNNANIQNESNSQRYAEAYDSPRKCCQ